MWKKEVWPEGGGGAGRRRSWSGGGAESEKAKSLSKQALHHFQVLGDLLVTPSYNMDTFISVQSQVNCPYLSFSDNAILLLF